MNNRVQVRSHPPARDSRADEKAKPSNTKVVGAARKGDKLVACGLLMASIGNVKRLLSQNIPMTCADEYSR